MLQSIKTQAVSFSSVQAFINYKPNGTPWKTNHKGLEPLEIYYEDIDQTETIYFNPSDSDLPKRLMECQKLIEERAKAIKPYETDENGLPDAESAIAYYEEANKIVYDALDYSFILLIKFRI